MRDRSRGSGTHPLLKSFLQFICLCQADDLFGKLAVFEDQQSGNGHDLELDGNVGIVIDVDLAEGNVGVPVHLARKAESYFIG